MDFSIADFVIGAGRTFVIAEIGNNHNGDLCLAKEMIDAAQGAGADCVKFQMRHLEHVYRSRTLSKQSDDLGTEYVIDLLNRFELTIEEHLELLNYSKSKQITYLCTPWDAKSLQVLEEFNVAAYKVASADLTNVPLIDKLIATGKPLILSTGMSLHSEIEFTVNRLKSAQANFALLHCNSTYPAPFQDILLKSMRKLQTLHPLVGYSGHERGIAVSIAAIALDACIVERHFTMDRSMEGPDHAASLEPTEFTRLVSGIREVELAMGDQDERKLSQGEMINRENLAKSLVSSKKIKKGTIIGPDHISVMSPGQGLSPQSYDELLGQELQRDMDEEDFFFRSDIECLVKTPTNYQFSRPWGIPVRYHDFNNFDKKIAPDIWEFHLSYSDMELNIGDYIEKQSDAGLVVHAPELFAESRLMDLAANDPEYRKASVLETQRVIDITREINLFFPNTKAPLIVANVGGFSLDEPLERSEVVGYYERLGESLNKLDRSNVEIIPQTMAPFPWHFGGQRYQNLFLRSDEIVHWCSEFGLRICLDVSHSKLACNHFGYNFADFVTEVSHFTAHVHIGDAVGVNGEGLQINEGEIDFPELGKILSLHCPSASFIPEIWQGHKNGGEGFWIALERLTGKL